MQCPFCHWSTRDLGIPDAPTAGSWPEKENLNQVIIGKIYEWQGIAENGHKQPK